MGCNDAENIKNGEDNIWAPGTKLTMGTARTTTRVVDDVEGGAWEILGTMLMTGKARTAARVVDDIEGGAWGEESQRPH